METKSLLVATYGLLFVLYIPFFFYFRRKAILRFGRRRFYSGLESILRSADKDSGVLVDDAASQIITLYKRLSEEYPAFSDRLRSAADATEDLLVCMDTSRDSQFKDFIGHDPPLDLRQEIVDAITALKKKQPFSAISSKKSNLLAILQQAVERGNKALAESSLSQLGDGIEILESSLRRQESQNRIAFTISVIGVVLTTFFGVVSFAQFILK